MDRSGDEGTESEVSGIGSGGRVCTCFFDMENVPSISRFRPPFLVIFSNNRKRSQNCF